DDVLAARGKESRRIGGLVAGGHDDGHPGVHRIVDRRLGRRRERAPAPAAHGMPSLMSAMVPPHLPSTRTACTFTLQFTPATPTALLVPPIPTVPATC